MCSASRALSACLVLDRRSVAQWAEIDGTVVPEAFSRQRDGRTDATVHQVVKNLDGDLFEDTTVHHIYRLRDGRVEHMEIGR